MGLRDELLKIEHRLAVGGGDEYREVLADDALVIVPGAVLDKSAALSSTYRLPDQKLLLHQQTPEA